MNWLDLCVTLLISCMDQSFLNDGTIYYTPCDFYLVFYQYLKCDTFIVLMYFDFILLFYYGMLLVLDLVANWNKDWLKIIKDYTNQITVQKGSRLSVAALLIFIFLRVFHGYA